jgi:archaeal flagellin FlaB
MSHRDTIISRLKQKVYNGTIADMGIGAMIVFIAMVLVAGIAASVLIQTANRLEIQAMTTGQETTGEVSSGLFIKNIDAMKVGPGLERIGITVQSRSGSHDIDLSKTYIEISNTVIKCVLFYTNGEFNLKSTIDGDLFSGGFFDACDSTHFGIIVLEDADLSLSTNTPVMNRGDKVMLTFNSLDCFGAELMPGADVFGMVQPEEGAPGFFGFHTTFLNANAVYTLY